MARIQSLLPSVLLAIAFASSTAAAPGASAEAEYLHAATRRTYTVGKRAVPIEAYHPPSSFETFGEGLEQPASLVDPDPQTEARQFVADRLKVDTETVNFRSAFNNGNVRHAYVRQELNGVPFANAVANVAFRENKVVSFGSSFVKPKDVADATPSIDINDVLPAVEETLDGKYNGHPTRLEYLARPDGSAALTFAAQIENVAENTWYEAFIDAHTGDLLSVVDFTADAAYRVLPIQKQALPEGTEVVTDPQDDFSSPSGWHAEGETLNTSGNNVISYKTSLTTGLATQSDADLFDYAYSDAFQPSNVTNVAAATVNAFYIINKIHDFTYRYGFTESTFNFQNDNFDKGGLGNDRVQVSVQDASGTNNANFATPPDGQPGRCRMYIWTSTQPNRDGALQNDILVHEVTHGISNRLTGGGGANCLQTTESRGLGEGWSDALAEWTQQKSETIVDYVLGNYVTNNPNGIRTKPYSVSNVTNPQTFASARGQSSVHRIGEIWANMLHNVYAALVGQHGWSATAMTTPEGTEGNVVWLHLFLDALALQPCNPGFVTARDAWIQADANRYGGANKCLLWRAFASRGLGLKAANFVDDFSAPTECEFKQEF